MEKKTQDESQIHYKRYEISDPRYETTWVEKTEEAIRKKATDVGSSTYNAVTQENETVRFVKQENEWRKQSEILAEVAEKLKQTEGARRQENTEASKQAKEQMTPEDQEALKSARREIGVPDAPKQEAKQPESRTDEKADNQTEVDPFGPPLEAAKPSAPTAVEPKKESEVVNSIEPVIEKEASAVKPADAKPAEKLVIHEETHEMLARQRAKDRAAVEEALGHGEAAAQPKPAEAETPAAKPAEKLVIHEETHEMLARQRAKDRAAVEEALEHGGAAAQLKPAEAETPAAMNKPPKENNIKSDEILTAEKEPTRPVLPREVEREYVNVGNKYYSQKNPNAEAFEDKGTKLETRSNSEQVAANLVKIAEARGWDEIKVAGTETFRREVWVEASARGMAVKGYTPNEQDKAALAARVKDIAANTVENGKSSEPVKTEATKADFRARENKKSAPEQGGKTIEQQRAESFKNDSRETALKKHPELSGAYAAQAAIHKKMDADGLTQEQKQYAQTKVRENIAKSIEAGKIPEVQKRQEVTVKREVQKTEERELSR